MLSSREHQFKWIKDFSVITRGSYKTGEEEEEEEGEGRKEEEGEGEKEEEDESLQDSLIC